MKITDSFIRQHTLRYRLEPISVARNSESLEDRILYDTGFTAPMIIFQCKISGLYREEQIPSFSLFVSIMAHHVVEEGRLN